MPPRIILQLIAKRYLLDLVLDDRLENQVKGQSLHFGHQGLGKSNIFGKKEVGAFLMLKDAGHY